MTTATATSVIHALHEWTEPNTIGVYPFLPHDIVQSITELVLIHQREVWFDKRNRERDMEIYGLRACHKARDFCPIEVSGRLSAPIFAIARQYPQLWNRKDKSWVIRIVADEQLWIPPPSYDNEGQFGADARDGGYWDISSIYDLEEY